MKTNSEKYNHILRLIEQNEIGFINSLSIPKKIYDVQDDGKIQTINIESLRYKSDVLLKYNPTRNDVMELKQRFENPKYYLDQIILNASIGIGPGAKHVFNFELNYTEIEKYFTDENEAKKSAQSKSAKF